MAHGPTPTAPFETVEQIKEANRRSGGYWFEPSTMRGFGTRLGQNVYGGRYFVTSEQFRGSTHWGPRRYSVREAMPDGSIETVGEFQDYATAAQARARIRELLKDAEQAAIKADLVVANASEPVGALVRAGAIERLRAAGVLEGA